MRRATSPYLFNEQRFEKWTAEGRGVGHGIDYKPWLRITNVPSTGRRHRVKSTVHGRVMHLMSDLERNCMFELEWRGCVDIREQFPLDRDHTRRIAKQMGIRHPRDPYSQVDIVMTTDLVRDVMTPDGIRVIPYFVKTVSELGKQRVRDKFEIERRYWSDLGMKLQIMTDKELRGRKFETIRWLREWHWTDGVEGRPAEFWANLANLAMEVVGSMQDRTVGEVCKVIARRGNISPGLAFSVLRHLGARRRLVVDIELGLPKLSDPISRFALSAAASARVAA